MRRHEVPEAIFVAKIEEIVRVIRLHLYNHGLPCGPKEIWKKMNESDEEPLPSERTISRILARQGLTHKRTGWYLVEERNG